MHDLMPDTQWDDEPWERRLTTKDKLRRGGLALAAVVVLAYVLLGGPAATIALLHGRATSQSTKPPPKPSASVGGVRLKLPPGSFGLPSISISPVNGSEGTAYACWISHPTFETDPDGALHVGQYVPSTDIWDTRAPPVARARVCSMQSDSDDARGVVLSVWNGTSPADGCHLPSLFVSMDAGHSWNPTPWPASDLQVCSPHLMLVSGVLYAWADTPFIPPASPHSGGGRILSTSDLGAHWRVLDRRLDDWIHVELAGIRPGGRLLAQATSLAGTQTLYASADGGVTWTEMGPLPGRNPAIHVSVNPSEFAASGWGQLYVSDASVADRISSAEPGVSFAASNDGARWVPVLTPRDLTTGGVERPQVLDVSVGPGDELLVMTALSTGAPETQTGERAIWVWNPQRATWALAPFVLPANGSLQGVAWFRGSVRFWVLLIAGTQQAFDLVTFLLPPDVP